MVKPKFDPKFGSQLFTQLALGLLVAGTTWAGEGLKGTFQGGNDAAQSDAVARSADAYARKLEAARAEREAAQRELNRINSDPSATHEQKNAAQKRLDQAHETVNGLENGNSKVIAQQYGQDISDTADQIQTGKIVTQLSMIGGQTATAVQGQLGTQKAAMEGTQSAAMKQGASLAGSTGMINMAVGAINLWYAQKHYQQMGAHDENRAAIQRDLVDRDLKNGVDGEVNANTYKYLEDQGVVQMGANNGFAQDAGTRQAQIQQVQATGRAAVAEQNAAREAAKQAMAQNLITGSVAMLNGAATIAAANQMKSAAQKLQTASTYGNLPTYTPGQITGAGDPLGGGATTITGDGSTAATGAASGDTASNSDGTGGLGDPYALPQPAAAPSNTPDVKTTAAGGGAPGGGGGGGMGGANTSPNTGTAEGDPQARMADNGRGASYEGSGGGFRGGGAGGGKGGADLSSLLAQFLPKKEDETSKNGILDYKKRAIASDDSSLLDRNANLFERIHNTYQAKQKRHEVGVMGLSGLEKRGGKIN